MAAAIIGALAAGCRHTYELPYYSTWKTNGIYTKPIEDPVRWTADNLADAPGVDISRKHMETKEVDIDHDGVAELFVWDKDRMGQHGGPVLVFKRLQSGYKYIGNPGTTEVKVLPLGEDGRPRMAVYEHRSAVEGAIFFLTNNGERFIVVSGELIFAGDSGTEEGNRRYREVFGER